MTERKWQELFEDNEGNSNSNKIELTNRIIGINGKANKGKVLMLMTAMLGDERAGIIAIQQVFKTLADESISLNGVLIGIVGNLMAVHLQKPFIHHDLNFQWGEQSISKTRNPSKRLVAANESMELIELLKIIEAYHIHKADNFLFANLESVEGKQQNYIQVNAEPNSMRLIRNFNLPILSDYEKFEEDGILAYFQRYSLPAINIRINASEEKNCINKIKSLIYQLLFQLNIIDKRFYERQQIEGFQEYKPKVLIPSKLKFIHKEFTKDHQGFSLNEGSINFKRLTKGEAFAKDSQTTIYASEDAYLFVNPLDASVAYYLLHEA